MSRAAAIISSRREPTRGRLGTARGVLFVTHDVEEAVLISDRVLVLSFRPARVMTEFPVPLRRPRGRADPEIQNMRATILGTLSKAHEEKR